MNISEKLLFITSIVISLVMLEIGLRVLTVFPVNYKSSKINDERLIFRLDPELDDIDERRFRNAPSNEPIKIVAIGDSFTYGHHVKSTDSWPQQLSQILDKRVYNFGVGGYGISQYQYLIDDALMLNPEHVVLALYIENDLDNICAHVLGGLWKRIISTYHINDDVCIARPLKKKIFKSRFSFGRNTAIGSVFQLLVREPLKFYINSLINMTDKQPDFLVLNDGKNDTLLRLKGIVKRKNATDINVDEVKLGLKLAKTMLVDAKTRADSKKIKFSMLFIPSKHRAFYKYLLDAHYELPGSYHDYVDNEQKLTNEISVTLAAAGIPFIDVTPFVEKALHENGHVYSVTSDGHPAEPGYRAYAIAAAELLSRQ